jgi:hypothetical protein
VLECTANVQGCPLRTGVVPMFTMTEGGLVGRGLSVDEPRLSGSLAVVVDMGTRIGTLLSLQQVVKDD